MNKKHEEALRLLLQPYKLESEIDDLLKVHGDALDRVQLDVDYLEANLLPDRATDETILSRWESLLGLPVPSGATTEERQQSIVAKLAATGGLSKAYFEALAASVGLIVEFILPPRFFRAGLSRANDKTFDPLKGFRALANSGAVVGGLVASTSRDDRSLHLAHNDEGQNLRVYNEGATPRQWVFGVVIYGSTREEADFFLNLLLELKPVETFVQWFFESGSSALGNTSGGNIVLTSGGKILLN